MVEATAKLIAMETARNTASMAGEKISSGQRDRKRAGLVGTQLQVLAPLILWPLAVVLGLQLLFVESLNGAVTDDFTTVYSALQRFLNGENIYEQVYHHTDPLYLYNPGATLFLSPIGLIASAEVARACFIFANAASIIASLAILTRMFGFSLRSALFPLSIVMAALTESVRNTLVFSNINGLLLLALVGYLWCLTKKQRWARWSAGLIIGLAIVVKPQFAPLLFLPFIMRWWSTIIVGIAVPVGLNLLAWPIAPGASNYRTELVPHLSQTRDFANSSLPGLAAYFDMPDWLYYPLWLFFAATAGVTILALLIIRRSDHLLWLVTTAGVLFCGVFFLSSLGQMYYSMLLFPMIFSVTRSRSVFHIWPTWLATILFLSPLNWVTTWTPNTALPVGQWINYFSATAGWALLLLTTAVCAISWLLHDRHQTSAQGLNGSAAEADRNTASRA